MKSVMKNSKVLATALFAAFTLSSSGSLLAKEDLKPSSAIDLKFLGSVQQKPVFQLNINNTSNDEFIVTFRDEQSNVLYSTRLKGSNITKNFQLSDEEGNGGAMSVEVKSKKTNKSEVYTINKTQTVTEEVVVNKL
jgi:hypothetical protein